MRVQLGEEEAGLRSVDGAAVERGATVELVSWKNSTNHAYTMLEMEHRPKFKIRYLDEHFDAVTYKWSRHA